jgi:hypothetical protein
MSCVRFSQSVDIQEFQKGMRVFFAKQNHLNQTYITLTAEYYNASAHLSIQLCAFLNTHVTLIHRLPISILHAIQKTLKHMMTLFETNRTIMDADLYNEFQKIAYAIYIQILPRLV